MIEEPLPVTGIDQNVTGQIMNQKPPSMGMMPGMYRTPEKTVGITRNYIL